MHCGQVKEQGVKVEATLLSLCSSNSPIVQATRVSLLRGQPPLQRLREILDGLLEARLELNLWFPTQDFAEQRGDRPYRDGWALRF